MGFKKFLVGHQKNIILIKLITKNRHKLKNPDEKNGNNNLPKIVTVEKLQKMDMNEI